MGERGDGGGTSARLLRAEEGGGGGHDIGKRSNRERPREPWRGEHVKSIVYSALDAIITCFSLISSISASHYSSADVLVLGFANLVADAISMGLGDYMSSSTEQHVIAEERHVTEWDVTNRRGSEQLDLVMHYQSLGMDITDATAVVNIFSRYKNILVDQRMAAEKGTLPADEEVKPWKNGLISFASFIIFGFAPLLSFIVLIPITDSDTVKFIGACIVSALALALLGVAKARIAGQRYVVSAATTVLNGALAAAAAYLVGCLLKSVAGLE